MAYFYAAIHWHFIFRNRTTADERLRETETVTSHQDKNAYNSYTQSKMSIKVSQSRAEQQAASHSQAKPMLDCSKSVNFNDLASRTREHAS